MAREFSRGVLMTIYSLLRNTTANSTTNSATYIVSVHSFTNGGALDNDYYKQRQTKALCDTVRPPWEGNDETTIGQEKNYKAIRKMKWSKFLHQTHIFDCCKQSLTRLSPPPLHPSIHPSIHPPIHWTRYFYLIRCNIHFHISILF